MDASTCPTGALPALDAPSASCGARHSRISTTDHIAGTPADLAPVQSTGMGVHSSLAQPAPNSGAAGQLAAPAFSEGAP